MDGNIHYKNRKGQFSTSSNRHKNEKPYFLLTLLLFAIIAGVTYWYSNNQEDNTDEVPRDPTEITTTPNNEEEESIEEIDTTKTYDNPSPEGYSGFFEIQETINTQLSYIAHPIEVGTENPPTIIIYNHGQFATITDDFTKYPMNNIREFASVATDAGYIFAASNQHGDSWGNAQSLQDNENLINWIKGNYSAQEKVNIIGFSMGGRPAVNQILADPTKVNALALLSPGTGYHEWGSKKAANYTLLKDIPAKLWHGTSDVNIAYSYNKAFVEEANSYEWMIELIPAEGQAHYYTDTKLHNEVIEFFNENK